MKVITVCGMGFGTSLMLLMSIKEIGKKHGVDIYEYTPLQVKSSIVGYGRAEKKQVQELVRTILHLKAVPKPDDAADALALAITHAYSINSRKLLGGR